jgi:hypothetical protein
MTKPDLTDEDYTDLAGLVREAIEAAFKSMERLCRHRFARPASCADRDVVADFGLSST